MVWKGAASVHWRIEVEIAWDTIRWAQCDSRKAGHKNADDDKRDEIFFSEIHKLWAIESTVFRDFFKTPHLAQTRGQALLWYAGFIFSKAAPLYLHCGIKSRILFNSVIFMFKAFYGRFQRTFEAAECGIGGDVKFVRCAGVIYKFYYWIHNSYRSQQAWPAIVEDFTLHIKNLPWQPHPPSIFGYSPYPQTVRFHRWQFG